MLILSSYLSRNYTFTVRFFLFLIISVNEVITFIFLDPCTYWRRTIILHSINWQPCTENADQNNGGKMPTKRGHENVAEKL